MRHLITLVFALLLAMPAAAQTRTGDTMQRVIGEVGQILFDAAERAIIERYYGRTATVILEEDTSDRQGKRDYKQGKKKDKDKGRRMPPGLAKKGGNLPPGLQRQLERNGRLPPGLAKRDLPTDLETQLPPAKPGCERVIAGADVVLIHAATGVVLDILRDVVTR
jgi:Ni/Co efflux regulator RcnB